jgi:hypothetical protein
MALAMAILCFWPPEIYVPLAPTCLSNPLPELLNPPFDGSCFSSSRIKERALAYSAYWRISCSFRSGVL